MKKFNLIFGMFLMSVLLLSVVSAGITGYQVKLNQKIPNTNIEVSRIDTTQGIVVVDGKEVPQMGTFVDETTGQTYQIQNVKPASWFLAKPSVEIVEVEEIWESVTCYFDDSTSLQQCNGKYADQSTSFSCEGIDSCTTKVHGISGGKVLWRSGCQGEIWTTIDGNNEYAKFSCTEETPCEQYTLQAGVQGITTPLGVNIALKLFENAQEFWLNIDGESGLHAGGKTFTLSSGEIATIIEISQIGGYVIVKVCPPEETPTPTTGPCCNMDCRWEFKQSEIGTATPEGAIKSVTAKCSPEEIVFWGSCYSYGVTQQGVELYEEYVEAGADYTCGFRKTKDPPFDATINAGALCCKPCS